MFNPDPRIKSFKLHQGKISLKQIGLILLVALFLIGAIWLAAPEKIAAPEVKESQTLKPQENIITPQIIRTTDENLRTELPQEFPKEITLHGETKIIESYSAIYPNLTTKQATVIFESEKTSRENYDFYLKWAENNQWRVINHSDEKILKSLYLKKGNEDINVIINEGVIIIGHVSL